MNRIIKILKHIFIPHEHNDYRPHFFRELSVGIISIGLVVLFSFSIGTKLYIEKFDMTAAVLPAVLVDLTNNARESEGITRLSRNSLLDKAAELKANDMASLGYFAHTSPEGLTPWHWFSKVNYLFSYAGENLAIDFSESVDVENAWLASPTHKANILNNKFTEIGIATVEGFYNGHPTTYVVQMFGKPASFNTEKDNTISSEIDSQVAVVSLDDREDVSSLVALAPDVKGEMVETNEATDDLEIIEENNEFISVKNNSVPEENLTPISTVQENYSKWYERLLFFTPSFVNVVFKLIVYIVVLALVLMIIVETKKQHLKSIVYGVLLLVILLCLIYINKSFFLFDFLL